LGYIKGKGCPFADDCAGRGWGSATPCCIGNIRCIRMITFEHLKWGFRCSFKSTVRNGTRKVYSYVRKLIHPVNRIQRLKGVQVYKRSRLSIVHSLILWLLAPACCSGSRMHNALFLNMQDVEIGRLWRVLNFFPKLLALFNCAYLFAWCVCHGASHPRAHMSPCLLSSTSSQSPTTKITHG